MVMILTKSKIFFFNFTSAKYYLIQVWRKCPQFQKSMVCCN